MAIITTLVGLGVLLVFTVLGCVLEVFLARRESIWPGLALPILAGLYAGDKISRSTKHGRIQYEVE